MTSFFTSIAILFIISIIIIIIYIFFLCYLFRNTMYDCKAPLSRFYYPETRRIINAFIIIIIINEWLTWSPSSEKPSTLAGASFVISWNNKQQRYERRETGRRRQETEEGGKDYQMRRWKSCGQHLTPDEGKKRKRERALWRECRHIALKKVSAYTIGWCLSINQCLCR